MTKITIIGPSGSGKSTLAKQLGDFYEVPVIHLDSLYFNPNWQEISSRKGNPSYSFNSTLDY